MEVVTKYPAEKAGAGVKHGLCPPSAKSSGKVWRDITIACWLQVVKLWADPERKAIRKHMIHGNVAKS